MNVLNLKIEELKWDSDFFGYKVGKLDLQNIKALNLLNLTIPQNEFKLIYIFTDSNKQELSEQLLNLGAKFLDRKTEYKINLSEIEIKNLKKDNISFKFLDTNDLNQDLIALAYEAGKNSRYKLDSNFKNQEFEKLYNIWLSRSLNKEIAFETIGIYLLNKLVGFITIGNKYDGANIGLVSINPEFQNQGLGSDLLNYCFEYLKNKNYTYLYVTTQGLSQQATNFYERNGFKLLNQTDIFHLWNNL